jgi:hypothetical protein
VLPFSFPAHAARSHSSVGASGSNALEWLILVRRRAACAAKNQKHLTNDRSQISFLR